MRLNIAHFCSTKVIPDWHEGRKKLRKITELINLAPDTYKEHGHREKEIETIRSSKIKSLWIIHSSRFVHLFLRYSSLEPGSRAQQPATTLSGV
jgi:hypothetical protein